MAWPAFSLRPQYAQSYDVCYAFLIEQTGRTHLPQQLSSPDLPVFKKLMQDLPPLQQHQKGLSISLMHPGLQKAAYHWVTLGSSLLNGLPFYY